MAGNALDFLINIQQRLTGGNVAGELGKLEQKIKAESAALAQLEASMRRINQGESVNIDAARALRTQIDAKKQSLAQLSEQWATMGGAQQAAGAGAQDLGSQLSALRAGPIGAVIAGIVAFTAVLVAATIKLAAFALSAADAHRSFMLVLQGATGSAAAAKEVSAAIDRVASKSSIAEAELQKMGRTLAVAGLTGKLFEQTLQTMANVAAVAGPEAASKLEEIVKKTKGLGHFEIGKEALAGLGISMEDLAKAMGMSVDQMQAAMKAGKISVEQGVDAMNKALNKRFGAAAEQQALSFGVQLAKLQENLAKLFRDVNIEPFLKGLKDVLSVFDQSTASGQALHHIVTEVFSGLFALVAKAAPYVKAFLMGMVIAALQFYFAAKQAWSTISGIVGSVGGLVGISSAVSAGKVAFYALLVVIGLVGVAIFIAFLPLIVVIGVVVAVVYGLYRAIAAIIGIAVAVGTAIANAFAKPIAAIQRGFARIAEALAPVFAAVGAVIDAALAPVIAVVSAVWGTISSGASAAYSAVASALAPLGELFSGIFDSLTSIDLGQIAANLIDGFVNGIVSGISAAIGAITSLGESVLGALSSVLKIASPSKATGKLGQFTHEGFTNEIEAGTPDAQAAMAAMAELPEPSTGKGGGKVGKTVRGGKIAETLVLIALDAEELWAQIEPYLDRALEGAADAGPEGAPA